MISFVEISIAQRNRSQCRRDGRLGAIDRQ